MDPSKKSGSRAFIIAVCALPAVLVIVQGLWLHMINAGLGFGLPIDDAYIFMRYADNIAEGHGFSFNPGETSFGSTSILWTLVLAFIYKVFFFSGNAVLSFWTGVVMYAVAVSLSSWSVVRVTGRPLAGLFAGTLMAGSVALFMNAVSGMEPPLTMLLLSVLALLILMENPHFFSAGLVAGLLTVTRPEGAYFAGGAIISWAILAILSRGARMPLKKLLLFVAGWAVFAVPAGAIIYAYTGHVLPGTYLGKILSTDPGVLERGLSERTVWALFSLGGGWERLAAPLRVLGVLAGLGCLVMVIKGLWSARRDKSEFPSFGVVLLFGYLFLPAAYGFSFPVGPPFGGYYHRYIAPVQMVAIILGTVGIWEAAGYMAGRLGVSGRRRMVSAAVLVLAAFIYLGRLWWPSISDGKHVFKQEVRLNTGIRMEAAHWLRNNTPEDARIMVGHTGLGVVGGLSERYVLDLGALINPDIFEYYKGTSSVPKKRWPSVVRYMKDRDISYYVTFAFPPERSDLFPDPAETDGIREIARLGTKGVPSTPYEQVRIYSVDLDGDSPEKSDKISD